MFANTIGTTAVLADADGALFHAPIAAWGKWDDNPKQMLTVPYLPAGRALVRIETYEELSRSEFVGFGGPDGQVITRSEQVVFLDPETDTIIHEGIAFRIAGMDRSDVDFSGIVRISGTTIGGKRGQIRIELPENEKVTVVRA